MKMEEKENKEGKQSVPDLSYICAVRQKHGACLKDYFLRWGHPRF